MQTIIKIIGKWPYTIICMMMMGACLYNKKSDEDKICLQEPPVVFTYIDSLLNQYGCVQCHNNGFQSGGVNLEGLGNVRQRASTGRLTQVMSNKSMPPNGSGYEKVPQSEIDKINRWICQGYKP